MPPVHHKIDRVQTRPPRVLDLFAGCGGLSLGFLASGYEIKAAVESDPDAARSHALNFANGDARHFRARDIIETSPDELTHELGLGKPEYAFDVIVGGPPCQAFARVGRSKLREVADHPEAFRHDPRSSLYVHYLNYVEKCAPLAVVLENVPDMLNYAGRNIAHEVCEVLASRDYVCRYTLLNAAHYGVPQMRERAFIVAVHKTVANEVLFPEPTHWIALPPGYEGSRAVALKLLNGSDTHGPDQFWSPPPEAHRALAPAVTAREAIGDLPPIYARQDLAQGKLKRGARRFDQPIAYTAEQHTLSEYARMMREWPGFAASDYLFDHVIRYLPRDYELFARMKAGDQYPQAYALAEALFEKEVAKRRKSGEILRQGSKKWKELRSRIVPPYDHRKFPNKWRKMEPDKPCRTLMAHLGKDSYSHIHYDDRQARTISVREAARLQSFPDGFVFSGTMNPAFRQIGNAVPPLLARSIAQTILSQLRGLQLRVDSSMAFGT